MAILRANGENGRWEREGEMEQAILGVITAVGLPLVLASVAFILAAYLEREIGIGPIKAPAPEPSLRGRWVGSGAVLGVAGVALIAGGAFALANSKDKDNEPASPTATAGTATASPVNPSPTVSALAATQTPTARAVTLLDLAGQWRTRNASEGDLLSLTITATSGTAARIEGAYQARFGVLPLDARDAAFSNGVLRSSAQWALGTSVDRLRLSSAVLEDGQLKVEIEHCVVGQLGTTCTPRTNTLVR